MGGTHENIASFLCYRVLCVSFRHQAARHSPWRQGGSLPHWWDHGAGRHRLPVRGELPAVQPAVDAVPRAGLPGPVHHLSGLRDDHSRDGWDRVSDAQGGKIHTSTKVIGINKKLTSKLLAQSSVAELELVLFGRSRCEGPAPAPH